MEQTPKYPITKFQSHELKCQAGLATTKYLAKKTSKYLPTLFDSKSFWKFHTSENQLILVKSWSYRRDVRLTPKNSVSAAGTLQCSWPTCYKNPPNHSHLGRMDYLSQLITLGTKQFRYLKMYYIFTSRELTNL